MASSRVYLSGAAKRKQRQIRNQNEAKSRRTLEGLNWYTKIRGTINLSPKELKLAVTKLYVKMILRPRMQIPSLLHTLLLRQWQVR